MSGRQVLRWQIPVDDVDHELVLAGDVLAVEPSRGLWSNVPAHWVSFWTVEVVDEAGAVVARTRPRPRVFRVFGTGHPIPDGYTWRGTAPRSPEGLVWHLFERVAGDR